MDDTNNSREAQGLSRSLILRKNSEWLPEPAMRLRKAYFCTDKTGYLRKKVEAPSMNMMGNPDMMNNMLKQNIQSVVHMMTFTVIGSVF